MEKLMEDLTNRERIMYGAAEEMSDILDFEHNFMTTCINLYKNPFRLGIVLIKRKTLENISVVVYADRMELFYNSHKEVIRIESTSEYPVVIAKEMVIHVNNFLKNIKKS